MVLWVFFILYSPVTTKFFWCALARCGRRRCCCCVLHRGICMQRTARGRLMDTIVIQLALFFKNSKRHFYHGQELLVPYNCIAPGWPFISRGPRTIPSLLVFGLCLFKCGNGVSNAS